MRALAVVLVVAFHAGLPVPGGFVGVDVFFVISGFVITGLLAREFDRDGRIRFRTFYRRRIQRLTPALAVMLAATLVLSILLQSPFGPQETTAITGIAAMFAVANFAIPVLSGGYFDAPAAANPLLNTWSLSVEEQFYVVFPLVLLAGLVFGRRRQRGRRYPLLAVGMLSGISFALMLVEISGRAFQGSLLFGFFGPVPRAWEFGVGAMLALAIGSRRTYGALSRTMAGWLGLGLVLGSALLMRESGPYPGLATVVPVAGTAALLFAGTGSQLTVSRFLSSRPMTLVGDISYSWYLWHWPLIVFALSVWPEVPSVALVAAALSLAPALVSYRFVEQPIRLRILRPRWGVMLLLAATVAPVLLLATVAIAGAKTGWGMSWVASSPSEESASFARGCHNEVFDPARCTWTTPGARGTVLLVGDSQAYALSDGLISAASGLGLSATVTSQNACPFADVSRIEWEPRYESEKDSCAPWNREVLEYALKERPSAVVIANRSPLYVNLDSDYATMLDGAGARATSTEVAASYWADALKAPISRLRAEGIPVVIVTEPPEGEPADLGGRQSILLRNPAIPPRAQRSDAESVRAPSFDAESALVGDMQGVELVDPFKELCPDAVCPGGRDGKPLYTDSTHLSKYGSLALTPMLSRALDSAMRSQ